ncbi:hypothetical protein H5P28_10360 [Ruficoccus amylovorans]|uniref:Uncharacterized protein n=1 Tax=Ruficoccus amylovorans TaxID=1804625 RepID=A0A842HE00_9BACT|nr:hypothetical protein [Ruficoccus amylovorans]MBC2594662.1 hypothetical protein [Ruficoccus amylovorans]
MSQDSNTENGSNAKRKLTLKRGKTAAPDSTPPHPAADGSGPAALPRMKFSPKNTGDKSSSATPVPPVEPLVPSTPLAKPSAETSAAPKPKLRTTPANFTPPPADDSEAPAEPSSPEATNNTAPASVPLSFSQTSPGARQPPPPSSPGAPKIPPGVKIVRDEPAPASGKSEAPASDLPPVLGPPPPIADEPMRPVSVPVTLMDSDLDVQPVRHRTGRNVLTVLLIFILILGALGGIAYGILSLIGDKDDTWEEWSTKPTQSSGDDSSASPIEDESAAALAPPEPEPVAIEIQPDLPEAVPATPTLALTDASPGQPSPSVTAWVEELRPNALMGTRMSINGTTYRLGDQVNSDPVIIWTGHDPDLNVLTFRDANGTIYEKDY